MVFYISVPLSRFEESADIIEREQLLPEIRMTDVNFMMSLAEDSLDRLKRIIDEKSFSIFTHGPFFGLDAASLDRNISEYSLRCLIHGLEITKALGGEVMVIHTGYLPQFSRGGRRHWFRNWAERMPPVIEMASESGITLALENTWDDRPEVLLHLADLLPGDEVRFCLDTGHVNVFSRVPLGRWLKVIGEKVIALHLHDNDGISDDHLQPGKGTFNFGELFTYFRKSDTMPLLDLEVDIQIARMGREYLERILRGIGGSLEV